MGDFNQVLRSEDKMGVWNLKLSLMLEGKSALADCDLHEIRFSGPTFT